MARRGAWRRGPVTIGRPGTQAVSTVRAGVRTLDGVGHSQTAPVPAQRILTRRRHIDLARVSSAFCCRAA
ncbi:putative leader peptide [Streptomyces niveus]